MELDSEMVTAWLVAQAEMKRVSEWEEQVGKQEERGGTGCIFKAHCSGLDVRAARGDWPSVHTVPTVASG